METQKILSCIHVLFLSFFAPRDQSIEIGEIMMTSDGDFPEDAVIEILARLPVKSVMRFKCICKFWYALVKTHSFIFKHLKNYNDDNIRLIVYYMDVFIHDIPVKYAFFPDETLANLSYQDLEPQMPVLGQILGPYDGLFCLYEKTYNRIFLWNLATRESRALPKCKTILPRYTNISYCTAGVGFDPISNGYKLVFIRNLWDDEEHSFCVFTRIMLYSLNNDYWRYLDVVELCHYFEIEMTSGNTYLDKSFYWLALRNDHRKVILSFHMDDEVFQEINVPHIPYTAHATLDVYDDSLYLLLSESRFNIWVMKDKRWTKQLNVGPLLEVSRPLGFWKNGTFFVESSSKQLLSYDPSTQELRNLKLKTDGVEVHSYKESLISLKRENELLDFFDIPWHLLGVYETNFD